MNQLPSPAAAETSSHGYGGARLARATADVHVAWLLLALGGVVGAVSLGVFGLPPVDLHGPLHRYGVMDPACGGTRATVALARGHWATAWRYNPGVFALALMAVAVLMRAAIGFTTGRWLGLSVSRRLVVTAGGLGLVLLEANQQMHAALLR